MDKAAARALVIDDERMNREVIVANLRTVGYDTATAEDGVQAWSILDAQPDAFDVILLDRRMPRMNGMELLAKLKNDPRLTHIPVIMQTAYAETEDISEGIKAGAYYYLAKPLDRRLLLSVTEAAIADHRRHRRLLDDLDKRTTAMLLLAQGRFRFRTLEEGHTLAVALARTCPQARHLVTGLSELFTNAVEHGNLGIDFDEKAQLLADRRWSQEIEARLDTPQGRSRQVEVEVERLGADVHFTIRDQGDGFDWRAFLDISPERAFAAHGRGIAMARRLAFDSLVFNDIGNQVTCVVAGAKPAIAAMTATAAEAAACVAAPPLAAAEPQAATEETELARSMQLELLPSAAAVSEVRRRSGIQLTTHFETSSSLGGDLWGLDIIDDHRVALWLADFAGHGLGAALNTFRLHTLVANCTPLSDLPAAFMTELNRRLIGLLPVGQYATMLYGLIDLPAGQFRYAAAAMPPPLFRQRDGSISRGDGAGLPLGLSAQARYGERQLPLTHGGLLMLASDGLADNPLTNDQKLGIKGIETLLQVCPHDSDGAAELLLAPFLAQVRRPLRDDLTVLCASVP